VVNLVRYTKPMPLTDGDCELAAKKLGEFFGQLNRKLLGTAPNTALRRLEFRDYPDDRYYLN